MRSPGPGRGYAGIDDDELIGVLVAWQKTEAWAAAGRLSAVAELIRRRPVPRSGAPRGPGGPEDVLASDALPGPGRTGAPRGREDAGGPRPGTPVPAVRVLSAPVPAVRVPIARSRRSGS
jgi:hypothetical protein